MYLLAHGLDPVEIAGMSSIAFIPILQKAIKTIDISMKAQGKTGRRGRFFGIIPIDSKSIWGGGMLISIMLGAIGAGCLSTLSPLPPINSPSPAAVPSTMTTGSPQPDAVPVAIPDGPPTPPIEEYSI
jgi:hypothetical protein